jgi:drug/metabolite transporter (DMT)-like permease
MRWVLLQFHLLVVLFSFTGILGEVITLDAPALVAWRTLLASAVYFLWVWLRTPGRLRAGRGHRGGIFLNGMVLGFHWICFFGAIKVSNVSIGLAGLSTMSLFTALIEAVGERRRPRWPEVALGLVVLGGLLTLMAGTAPGGLFSLGEKAGTVLPGLLIALLGAFLAAVFSVVNRGFVLKGIPSTTILVFGMPGSCAAALLLIVAVPIPWFAPEVPARADWLPLLALVLGCTFLAYIWYTNLMRHLTAYTSNMIANLEPVYGTLLAALILHEHEGLTPLFYAGLSTIVLANVLHARLESRRLQRTERPAPAPL